MERKAFLKNRQVPDKLKVKKEMFVNYLCPLPLETSAKKINGNCK